MKLVLYLIMLTATVLSSCDARSAHEGKQLVDSPPNMAKAAAPTTVKPVVALENVAFDVPALLNKNIDQITQQLGKPKEEDAPNLTTDELERRYTRKGHRLVISFNQKTRQVVGFFLSAPGPSDETKDCGKILEAGNLNPSSTAYAIDTLRSEKKGYFTGVVVTE